MLAAANMRIFAPLLAALLPSALAIGPSVMDILNSSPNYSMFAAFVNNCVGLNATLEFQGNFTVFGA